MSAKKRLVVIVLVSLFFGVQMSIIKGNNDGIRSAIGNISAPWLLLPFLASVYAKRRRAIEGALVGLLASICGLTGFYFANSFVLDLGPHPWSVDLMLTMSGMWFWGLLSLMSGPFLGVLGEWCILRRTLIPSLFVALLFVFEPLTWKVYDIGGFNSYPILSVIETTVGIVACIVIISCRFKLSQGR